MIQKWFDKKYLVDELQLPGAAIEKRMCHSAGPFVIEFEIIFKDKDNKYWRTHYITGKEPWIGQEKVPCTRVKRAPIVEWKFVDYDKEIDLQLFDLLVGDDLK